MKTNKIIAFILSVIFIFSINVTGFASEETATFEPVLHAETLNMLSSLGVTDELIFDAGIICKVYILCNISFQCTSE